MSERESGRSSCSLRCRPVQTPAAPPTGSGPRAPAALDAEAEGRQERAEDFGTEQGLRFDGHAGFSRGSGMGCDGIARFYDVRAGSTTERSPDPGRFPCRGRSPSPSPRAPSAGGEGIQS
jgi:hypothetical protein